MFDVKMIGPSLSGARRLMMVCGAAGAVMLSGCENESGVTGDAAATERAQDAATEGAMEQDGAYDEGAYDEDATTGVQEDPGAAPSEHTADRALGEVTVGGVTFDVAVGGRVGEDEELHVSLVRTGGEGAQAVRVWVGGAVEEADALKALAEQEGSTYHAHVEAPVAAGEGSMLWIEVENANGERTAESIPLN